MVPEFQKDVEDVQMPVLVPELLLLEECDALLGTTFAGKVSDNLIHPTFQEFHVWFFEEDVEQMEPRAATKKMWF